MYKVRATENIFNGYYFWYLARSLVDMNSSGVISLDIIKDNRFKYDIADVGIYNHTGLIYINDFPIYFDVFDTPKFWYESLINEDNFILLKGNRSEEILNGLVQCPNELGDFVVTNKNRVVNFAYGRVFSIPFDTKELLVYIHKRYKKYKIVSYNGPGLEDIHTESRAKVYDCINSLGKKVKLVYRKRPDIPSKYDGDFCLKYPEVFSHFPNLSELYQFIGSGEFSINTPGIGLSQPAKLVDAVISGTAAISTIIYQDIYKDFPCVQIPVCGYYGTGDWEKVKETLENLDSINWDKMHGDSLVWYNKYLSAEGLWKNQLLKAYEKGTQ